MRDRVSGYQSLQNWPQPSIFFCKWDFVFRNAGGSAARSSGLLYIIGGHLGEKLLEAVPLGGTFRGGGKRVTQYILYAYNPALLVYRYNIYIYIYDII